MVLVNKNIILLLLNFFIFFSCSDEELINPYKDIEEGIPVTTSLSFSSSNTVKVETKASDIADSNPVNSLAILIFKKTAGGSVKIGETKFCSKEEIEGQSIKVSTTSGSRYVYAVANYKSSLFDLEAQLTTDIKTLDDLKDLSVKLPEKNISVLDNQFLMSGAFVGKVGDDEGLCVIGTDGTIKNIDAGDNSGKIDLKRIMASVKFNISCETDDGATFVADSWQVKNVPQQSFIIERTSGDYSGETDDYFQSKLNSSFDIVDKTYSFSFLMMENRKEPKRAPASYDDREKMEDSPENFVVANDNSTYVVLKGTYTGKTSETVDGDKTEKEVKAFTTYYVHLGDWRETLSDFNVLRNNRYIYTVKITSVNSLIVEVVKDDGSREAWGSDGDLYLSTTNVRTFDAHYETTVISFDKTMIRTLIYGEGTQPCTKEVFIDKFKILASTPENNFSSNTTDINWVKYKRNTAGYNGFMKYKESESDEPLDADGFRSDLYDACIKDEGFGTDDLIRYTCFIDEYYYAGKPLREFINQQPRTIQIWTYYKKNTEPSSNSSISMAAYTFSQRSICTIYDLDKLDANQTVNGWGTEWTQEGDNLPTAITTSNNLNSFVDSKEKHNNDLLQGRQNMVTQLTPLQRWDDYVDYKTNDMQAQYKYAEYACLNRNRDLDGNGVLDENEIHWYLPAINQYMGYSMGEDVLPKEVRLFTGNTYDLRYIYTSNTVVNKKGIVGQSGTDYDTEVFWACEGSSIGYFRDANGSEKPYRCVRNLRSVSAPVNDFVVPSEDIKKGRELNGYTDLSFEYLDFSYLNSGAMRKQVNQALTPYHKNTEEENRLPEGIEIGEVEKEYYEVVPGTILPTSYKELTLGDAVHTNPCQKLGEGWRLPNQRELTVMTSHVAVLDYNENLVKGEYGFESKSLVCCTMSKYTPSDSGSRVYFSYYVESSGLHNMSMGEPDFPRNYRCVKDKKITKNK